MKYVRKRNSRLEEFDGNRIAKAIWKAARAVGGNNRETANRLSEQVIQSLRPG